MKYKHSFFKYVILMAITIFVGMSFTYGQTLKHSYTFDEGTYNATTVFDQTGNLDGTLGGDKISIADGLVTVSGATANDNGWISLNGEDLALNTYSAITIEVFLETGETLNTGYTMLSYFGSSSAGQNCFWIQPTRSGNETRLEVNNGSTTVTASKTNYEVDDGKKHHLVAELTTDVLRYYLDGAIIAEESTGGTDYISTIGTDVANIFRGVDGWNDPNYNASIDEYKIYDGALAKETIIEHLSEYLGVDPDDASLSAINSSHGSLDPAFSPDVKIYELNVEYGSTTVTIEPLPTVSNAQVDIVDGLGSTINNGVVNFTEEGIGVIIDVTAMNGTTKETYYVSINLMPEEESTTLADMEISVGNILDFDPNNLDVTATVPYGTDSVVITATPTNNECTVSGDGTITLIDGVGIATISVTSADGSTTRTYTVTITDSEITAGVDYFIVHQVTDYVATESQESPNRLRLEEPISREPTQIWNFVETDVEGQYYIQNKLGNYIALQEPSVNNWSIVIEDQLLSDPDSISFTLDEFEPGSFHIESVVRSSSSSPEKNMMGTNDSNLGTEVFSDKWDDSSWDVDGLTIWKILPTEDVVDPYDTYLSSLSITEVDLNPEFDKVEEEYFVIVPDGVTSLTVSAVANDEICTVTGAGSIDVSDGKGSFTITVTAPDPEYKRDYVVNYQKDTPLTLKHSYSFTNGTAQDHEGTAHGIVKSGAIANGTFTSSAEDDYIVLPAKEIAINEYPSITFEAYIKAGANDEATMLFYFGNETGGENAIYCQITTESDEDSSRIAVNQKVVNYAKGPEPATGEDHHYVGVLTNDTLKWYIDGVLSATQAIDSGFAIGKTHSDNAWINYGSYDDPTWYGAIYELNIYSGQMDAATVAAHAANFPTDDETTNATLSSLMVDGEDIDGFLPALLEYKVELPRTVTAVPPVTVTTTNSNANAVVADTSEIPGTTTVVVTAEDGVTTVTYRVKFVYEVSSVSSLSDLTVDGTTIEGFDPEVTYYTYFVDDDETIVPEVAYETTNSYASVVMNAATGIPGITRIEVTAEDGVTVTNYTIVFTTSGATIDATLSDLKVDGTTIDGFSPTTVAYVVYLPDGTTTVPAVTATPSSEMARAVVTPAPSIPGTTTITVTAGDGATKKNYSVSFVIGTAVDDNELPVPMVYPTVFKNSFKVKTTGGVHNITIFNVTGKEIMNKNNVTGEVEINIANTGMYIVKLEGNGLINTYKVFKIE